MSVNEVNKSETNPVDKQINTGSITMTFGNSVTLSEEVNERLKKGETVFVSNYGPTQHDLVYRLPPDPSVPNKWDIRFLELATFISQWSKDQSTKTGAVVIGPHREIRATGYNGLCRGVNDAMPERQERPTKYDFFEHAERNAIFNACLTGTQLYGCTIYCTHAPCPDCARAIIQSGIRKVWTHKVDMTNAPKGTWRDKLDISRQMFKEAGVEYYEI